MAIWICSWYLTMLPRSPHPRSELSCQLSSGENAIEHTQRKGAPASFLVPTSQIRTVCPRGAKPRAFHQVRMRRIIPNLYVLKMASPPASLSLPPRSELFCQARLAPTIRRECDRLYFRCSPVDEQDLREAKKGSGEVLRFKKNAADSIS